MELNKYSYWNNQSSWRGIKCDKEIWEQGLKKGKEKTVELSVTV